MKSIANLRVQEQGLLYGLGEVMLIPKVSGVGLKGPKGKKMEGLVDNFGKEKVSIAVVLL